MLLEKQILEFLELYSLEEAFEVLDITPENVLEILISGGHVQLPEFLGRDFEDGQTEET